MEPLLSLRMIGSLSLVVSAVVGAGEIGIRGTNHFDARTVVQEDVHVSEPATSMDAAVSAAAAMEAGVGAGAASSTNVRAVEDVSGIAVVDASVPDSSLVTPGTHTATSSSAQAHATGSAQAHATGATTVAVAREELSSTVHAIGGVTADTQAGAALTSVTPPLHTSVSTGTAAATDLTIVLQGR